MAENNSKRGFAHTNHTAKCLDGIRILLVEDAVENRTLMEFFLSMAGATIETAADGTAAVRHAAEGRHDVIVMDIQMPTMDGITATRILRQQGFRKPVIALTGLATAEERARCFAAGFDEHLVKPVSLSEIYAAIVTLVRKAG